MEGASLSYIALGTRDLEVLLLINDIAHCYCTLCYLHTLIEPQNRNEKSYEATAMPKRSSGEVW